MNTTTILIMLLIGLNVLVWSALGYIDLSHPFGVSIQTIPARILEGIIKP